MDELRAVLRKYWGYEGFRPLQAEAMASVLAGRDSVVILPTGGGKSLCYQAPALQMPGLAVILSPLISLMKDQVDALADCGVPAACINSALPFDQRRQVADEIRGGRVKILYLSPERLMAPRTLEFLRHVPLSFFAIDEAHCISEWGHDFRPEYRMLRTLKEKFPGVAVHAYTATATGRVREDIAAELQLENPQILVGSFDRPNLIYRVQRRTDLMQQLRAVIDRHPGESGIIYCIRRADVDQVSEDLCAAGLRALPYHAGMDDESRRQNQDAFINDRAPIIVATVAFGMGIDKSDVRYVIHAGCPKSLESYQQESGRAGRDGLEAECWLLYSAKDFQTWRRLQEDLPPEAFKVAMAVLSGIDNYCTAVTCRHRALVEYFGQQLPGDNCGACDVCLAEVELVEDALVVGQKILSCVVRLKESFGADYTAQVLGGSREQRILDNGHDKLSTWGLLAEQDKPIIRAWIEQLVGQGFLLKGGEYNVLQVPPAGWRVLRGEAVPRLLKPAKRPRKQSKPARESWDGVDTGLYDILRTFRRQKAEQHGVAPFIIFSDATLRDLARRRPSTLVRLRDVHGIGDKKSAEYGAELIELIADHCRSAGVAPDAKVEPDAVPRTRSDEPRSTNESQRRAARLFSGGKTIDEVCRELDRSRATTIGYLMEHIDEQEISDPTGWVDPKVFEKIRSAAAIVGTERLKPVFEALGGAVPYDEIRIAIACLRNAGMPERPV